MRAVYLWAPLKFLFAKGKIGRVPVPAIVIPTLLAEIPRWVGMFSYHAKLSIYIVYFILACIAAGGGSVIGSVILIDKLSSEKLRKKMSDEEWAYYVHMDKRKKYLPAHLQKEPIADKFARWWNAIDDSLIFNYIRAKHDKICPIITFE
jgi:hypothetical protein